MKVFVFVFKHFRSQCEVHGVISHCPYGGTAETLQITEAVLVQLLSLVWSDLGLIQYPGEKEPLKGQASFALPSHLRFPSYTSCETLPSTGSLRKLLCPLLTLYCSPLSLSSPQRMSQIYQARSLLVMLILTPFAAFHWQCPWTFMQLACLFMISFPENS